MMTDQEMRQPMTPEAFARAMRRLGNDWDTESAHLEADRLMCALLGALGYKAGVKAFEEMLKWYAKGVCVRLCSATIDRLGAWRGYHARLRLRADEDAKADADSYLDGDADLDGNGYRNANRRADGHTDVYGDANGDSYSHRDFDAYVDGNANGRAAYANEHGDGGAAYYDPNTDTRANGPTESDGHTVADVDTHTRTAISAQSRWGVGRHDMAQGRGDVCWRNAPVYATGLDTHTTS